MTAQTSGPGSAPVDTVGAASGSEPTMSGPELTVNVPLLRKAVEWVEAEGTRPRRERQWYQRGVVTPAAAINRDCGTCYCVAGYIALVVAGPERAAEDAIGIAIDALGLDSRGRGLRGLFCVGNDAADVRRIAEEIAGERL